MMPSVGIPATVGILTAVYFVLFIGCSQLMEFPPANLLKSVRLRFSPLHLVFST
jgi:hypothetical protein